MSQANWYYLVGEQQNGPVSFEDIKQLATEGRITQESFVWREGYQNWVKAWQVQGLFPDGSVHSGINPPPSPDIFNAPQYPDTEHKFVYAGFWRRFGALFIDWLIFFGFSFVAGFIAGVIFVGQPEHLQGVIPIIQIVSIFAWWLYFALMESSSRQASLGKMALGIKVVDLRGNRVSFGRATGRHFAKIISGLILGIGYIMAGFTEKKQTLHDMMAGALVVDRDS